MSYWRNDAVCRYYDPELMFPPGGPETAARAEMAAVALSLCSVCPVTQQCAQLARDLKLQDGVWGGVDLGNFPPTRQGTKARNAALKAPARVTEAVTA